MTSPVFCLFIYIKKKISGIQNIGSLWFTVMYICSVVLETSIVLGVESINLQVSTKGITGHQFVSD